MFALLAVVFFAVLLVLELAGHATAGAVLLDLGLLCVACSLAFGHVVPMPWRRG